MQDLNFYLKDLRLLKDSPNIEQLLRELENKEDKQETVRSIVTEVLASIWQYRQDKKLVTWTTTACFPKRFLRLPFNIQQANIPHKSAEEFLRCEWISRSENILMCGASGLGKTHFSVAIGQQAIAKGYRTRFVTASKLFKELGKAVQMALPIYERKLQSLDGVDLLIIDDMGNGSVPIDSGSYFYEIMDRRHDKGLSTIITTNKMVSSWGAALGDSTSVRAGLDRFLEFAYKLKFTGKSLRLESFNKRNKTNIQNCTDAITRD